MKYLAIIIIILASGLGVFNATKINFEAPFEGDSIIGVITVVAALCAIMLMLILMVSKQIEAKMKNRE